MIVEQRTYTCYCGKAQQYVKMYESEGLAIQRPILGHLLGYFTSEIGEVNQVVHLGARRSRLREARQSPWSRRGCGRGVSSGASGHRTPRLRLT